MQRVAEEGIAVGVSISLAGRYATQDRGGVERGALSGRQK